MIERFIVAEVSRNWKGNNLLVEGPTLSELFEGVIERNLERGYWLNQFQLHRLMVSADEMNETIIAVFEKE